MLSSGVHELVSESELAALYCDDPQEFVRRVMQEADSREHEDDIALIAFRPGS